MIHVWLAAGEKETSAESHLLWESLTSVLQTATGFSSLQSAARRANTATFTTATAVETSQTPFSCSPV